jgi:hypothetical protein
LTSSPYLATVHVDARPALALRARRFLAAFGVVVAGLPVASAWAEWASGGSGAGVATSQAMPAGPTPQVSVQGRNVTVSWAATALAGGEPVSAYQVRRVAANGSAATVGSACNSTQTGLSCTETAVAPGSWSYGVTALLESWIGTEGARTTATVGAPAFTLAAPATVTTLPAAVTGTITDYVGPATLTFRLDDPTTGQLLSATPAGIPAAGTAQVSVTIPAGVATGTHTVYAIGSGGDTVGASVLVAANLLRPTALTITNGGTTAGLAEQGDSVSITFSEPLKASSVCATWADDGVAKALTTGVTASITNDGSPSSPDILAVAAAGCGPNGLRFGSLNLGDKGFVRGHSAGTFGAVGTSSTVTWDPATATLGIVLGTPSGNFGTISGSTTAVYTPNPAVTNAAGVLVTGTASRTGTQL